MKSVSQGLVSALALAFQRHALLNQQERNRITVALPLSIGWALYPHLGLAATLTTLVDNGPSSNRVDVVFLGDGYTASDLTAGTFDQHIVNYLDYWFADSNNSAPFFRYRNYFNIHKVDIVSNQSGADRLPEGILRDTALDAAYYFDGGPDRLLYINENKANSLRDQALSDASFRAEMQYIVVNSDRYGGGGGNYSVFAGGNEDASELALHEVAHAFSHLADEYVTWATTYSGPEPVAANITKSSTGAKWSQWLGYEQDGLGEIGVYEGAGYYEKGLYRPSQTSKMRSLGYPFNAISREQIILDIYQFVDPLDAWLSNQTPLLDPEAIYVSVIDDEVIHLQWFWDGVLMPDVTTPIFDMSQFEHGTGEYELTVRAFDPTAFDPVNGWVRINSSALEQFVSWQIRLTDDPEHSASVPEPSTLVFISLAGIAVLDWQRQRHS